MVSELSAYTEAGNLTQSTLSPQNAKACYDEKATRRSLSIFLNKQNTNQEALFKWIFLIGKRNEWETFPY